jgi:tRNA(Ile)-lysidine synthase
VYVADGALAGGGNLEERARTRRYELLSQIARRERFRRVATGHTLDDQAETVLHRLIRGSGLGGLAGIHPERADGIVRPLLDVSRRDVLEFLRRRGLRHRTDRSNEGRRFTRNQIRRLVLPLLETEFNPAIKAALGRLADLARDDEAVLDDIAGRGARSLVARGGLDCATLARLPAALQRRIVRVWLASSRGDVRAIELEHVERVRELATTGGEGKRLALPGGLVLHNGGMLWWRHAAPVSRRYVRTLDAGGEVAVHGWRLRARAVRDGAKPGPWRAVFDARALQDATLTVRSAKPGDRIRPLGLGGSKKLQDVFVDAKVPRMQRAGWPVIETAGRILWVPGLVRSDFAPVGSERRGLLVIEAERVAAENPMCYRPNGRRIEPSFTKRRALAGARVDGAAAVQPAEPPGGTRPRNHLQRVPHRRREG